MRKRDNKAPMLLCLIVLLLGFGAIWMFIQSEGIAFAKVGDGEQFITKREFDRVLTLEERQPIYMKSTSLNQIGELAANQPVAIIGEDEVYYEMRLGNMSAFVRKGQGKVEKQKLATLVHTERLAAVHSLQKTVVYEEANMESTVILELEEGYRYPVVQEEGDWYILTIGERPGYIHKQSVVLDEGIPVLVYHHILPLESMTTMNSTISVELFEKQMEYLASRQFKTLTAHQLYDYLEGRLVVPQKAVLITFDDGLLSTKEYAHPILKRYGFSAIQHIISSRTDRGQGAQLFDADGPLQYLTAADLSELTDVFQFEAHTNELHSLNGDSGVALQRSQEEILLDLQGNLEQVPAAVSIAYPYGHYNEHFIEAAKEAGLLIGFTIIEGYANMKSSNYEVSRFGMTEKRSFEQFVTYVEGDMTWP
ncbi:polysaccharide deacetylase family protein [Sporosarcina sp. ACRSL]|uniref:polysaccharide deacetylase family protein n=1 Tax=Sporosarcina sp. ACRSL TaxID=2918215 RepID=UPI001EF6E8BD|nr:polysaccharide deacetylase family protein [Sporosarcina sp. ACRSL]MCG7344886.1 polysaccharide deacetylase family protein [Sporosarcina sp. ACRSL]